MYIKNAKQVFYTEHMQYVLYKATLLHKAIVWDNAEQVKFDAKQYGFDFSKYDFAGVKEENVEENLVSLLPDVYKNGFLTKRTRFTAQEVETAFAFLQGFARAKFKKDCGLINPLPRWM